MLGIYKQYLFNSVPDLSPLVSYFGSPNQITEKRRKLKPKLFSLVLGFALLVFGNVTTSASAVEIKLH